MIDIPMFQSNLGNHFSNPRVVARDVLLYEENDAQGRPFALHYFAITADLAATANNLEDFQDEVLGNTYYETPGDLRWNHYLYFVVDGSALTSPEGLKEKTRIESNQSYARKFVLTGDELLRELAQRELAVSASEMGVESDVINRWASLLIDANLDVVLEQRGLADTVRGIGYGRQVERTGRASAQPMRNVHPLSDVFISRLEIESFRDYLIDRTFDGLGTVNLIVGGNGTGKTSILEAIEYLFCSDNARVTPTQSVHMRGYVTNESETVEIRPSTSTDELKSRNLMWYGTRDLRGSSLANSFSRYNFLSTDEAALLAQDPHLDLDDLLSRVVAGPKAADLWSHITRLIDPVDSEISKTESSLHRWEAEKRANQEEIKNASTKHSEVGHAFFVLSEDLRRLKWKSSFNKENIESEVLPKLQIAYSLTREIIEGDWAEGTDTPLAIRRQSKQEQHRLAALRDLFNNISGEKKKNVELETELQKHTQGLSLVDEVKTVVASDVLDVIRAVEHQEAKLADERKRITSSSFININPAEDLAVAKGLEMPLDEEVGHLVEEDKKLLAEIRDVSSNVKALKITKSKNQVLLQDIRRLAKQLSEYHQGMDHCPVCQTEFDAAELHRRILISVEFTADEALEILVKRLDALTTDQANFKARRAQLEDACGYARAQGLDTSSITFSDAIKIISADRARILSIQKKLDRSRERLAVLAESGLSQQKVLDVINRAKIAGITTIAPPSLAQTRLTIQRECISLEKRLLEVRQSLDDLKQKFLSSFLSLNTSVEMASVVGEEKMLAIAERRCSLFKRAENRIDHVGEFLDIDEGTSIAGVSALIGSTIAAVEKYIAVSANEQRFGSIKHTLQERLANLETAILSDTTILKQLVSAADILKKIRTDYPLAKATEDELQSVSKVTAAIFGKIHSPREYGVRRGLKQPLFRLATGKATSLKEISTGQRAAFVLSLFLAMNSKLRNAPRVILLDDPIAHIDDLNSLSFLDHLRHLVLTGRRQVFYATADARQAGLIEHKFGFLGREFKRIDLVR